MVERLFPFLMWWGRVNRRTLRADLLAGLTGGLIVIPQGVAFATIAGLPPEYGLYTAMLPAVVAALWGSSWHMVSGPTTAISLAVFATISPLAAPGTPAYVGLVLTLTLLVGGFQLLLGLLRMGSLINFVSHTVVVAFTAGAAILIAVSQVGNFFGISIERGASVKGVVLGFAAAFDSINLYVTAVAITTVLTCVVFKRWWPRVPHMIAGLIGGGLIAALFNAVAGDEAVTGIRSIGALAIGLPPLSIPHVSPVMLEKLAPIAIAVAILALTEATSIARSIAVRTHQRIDGNQELIGQGLSNVAGAFFSGYASSGSFNRSGLNYDAGAQTPLAAVAAAVFLLIIMLFLAPLGQYLPIAAMAGLLFVVAWGLIDGNEIRRIVRAGPQETVVLAATFMATLSFNLEYAIYIGVLLSLVLYLNRTSQPLLDTLAPGLQGWPVTFSDNRVEPGIEPIRIVRLNGSIFFGAVDHLQQSLQSIDKVDPSQRHVMLVASGVNFVDLAGAHLLAREARRRRALGGALYCYHVKPDVREMLQKTGALTEIGEENMFDLGEDAVAIIRARIDSAH